MAKSRSRIEIGGTGAPWNQPLSGLSALRDSLPASPSAVAVGASSGEPGKPTAKVEAGPFARAGRIVLRRERKGHGGKTVTRVEGLACSAVELDVALREIKRSLGCGAAIEHADILVQGDQTERLRAFLESRGAKRIVLGN